MSADEERRRRLEERLTLAREMMGSLDPLDFIESWLAPDERYRSNTSRQLRFPASLTRRYERSMVGYSLCATAVWPEAPCLPSGV